MSCTNTYIGTSMYVSPMVSLAPPTTRRSIIRRSIQCNQSNRAATTTIADFFEDYRVPINTASRLALLNCAFLIIFIKVNKPIDVTQQPQKNEGKNDQVHVYLSYVLSSKVLTPSSLGSGQPHCGMSLDPSSTTSFERFL